MNPIFFSRLRTAVRLLVLTAVCPLFAEPPADEFFGLPAGAEFGWYAVPPMSEEPRLPDTRPMDGTPLGTVRIIAARDEYEPGSFVIRPLADLGKVELAVDDFLTRDGRLFPAEQLDLKVVKVWYQNGNGWYSYFGDLGFKLTPELLLHDEELIQVDTERPANYARLTAPDGTVSRQWLTPPPQFDRRMEEHYRFPSVFSSMKPDFRDAPSLCPVTFRKGEGKQFFLTAHVTEDTPAGLYRGKITLTRDGRRLGAVPVTIRVLPFTLPAPKTSYDPTRDFLVTAYNYSAFSHIAEENGGDFELAEKQSLAMMKNLKSHNQAFHWIRGGGVVGNEEYARNIELMKEAGLRTDMIFAMTNVRNCGNSLELARSAKLLRQYNEKLLGHNRVFLGVGDEPGANWIMNTRPLFQAFQKEGFKFIIAGTNTVFYKAGYLYDFYNASQPPENEPFTQKWRTVGKAWVAWYAQQHVGPENPAFNRRQYGLTPYLSNFSAACNYAHHFGPYNDRTCGYRPMVFAYGCYDGVLDTLQWEGFREGVDDIRYATLLKTLAGTAAKSPDLNVQYLGGQALQFLGETDPVGADLNTVRLEMIRHILKLRAALKLN